MLGRLDRFGGIVGVACTAPVELAILHMIPVFSMYVSNAWMGVKFQFMSDTRSYVGCGLSELEFRRVNNAASSTYISLIPESLKSEGVHVLIMSEWHSRYSNIGVDEQYSSQ